LKNKIYFHLKAKMKIILLFTSITTAMAFVQPSSPSLKYIAQSLSQQGKGILAADESTATIGKRFDSIGVVNKLDNRFNYRNMLFTTPNLEKYISGVILYQETLEDTRLVDELKHKGILLGIKVDQGLQLLPGSNNENWVSGMDTLAFKSKKAYDLGARFAKWRAVFKISSHQNLPTAQSIHENCWGLARYAKTVQEQGLVPIVEPEILMDGDHSLEQTRRIQEKILKQVYEYLEMNKVDLQGTLLKPSFTVPGIDYCVKYSPDQIASATLETLRRTVPYSVPGIMFLSGGLSEAHATQILNEMNKQKTSEAWNLSFSFGRALQNSCLETWKGLDVNTRTAQQKLLQCAQANSNATLGTYDSESQETQENKSLFVSEYSY